MLADVDPLFCPLDEESIDSDETLLVADIIDAFGGVISRPSELCCEKLNIGFEKILIRILKIFELNFFKNISFFLPEIIRLSNFTIKL